MKAVLKAIVLILVGIPLVALLWLLADGTRPYLRSGAPPLLDIPRGVRTRQIAVQLQDAGIIRSQWTFLALHSLHPRDTLKAGEYAFEEPASPFQVLRKLVRGDVSYEEVTIPEGFNRFEIADVVAAHGFSTREEFLRATEDTAALAGLDPKARDLEGYLFPDSYQFPRHARPAEIIQTMVDRFRTVRAELHLDSDPRPIHEIVTLASLVEKETGARDERPLIAGIFYNRLQHGIALQCDPTVVYAQILENREVGTLRKSDLKFRSPYNTYLNRGLPPGPIANPGKASLFAVKNPSESEYLYFVASGVGGHTFSKTLAEHNVAVDLYREARQRARELEQSAASARP